MDIANLRHDVKMENGIILHSPGNVRYSRSKISNNTHHFRKENALLFIIIRYTCLTPLVLLVGRCPPLPEMKHATPDASLAVNGTIANYTCEEGHLFSTTTLNTAVSCKVV